MLHTGIVPTQKQSQDLEPLSIDDAEHVVSYFSL